MTSKTRPASASFMENCQKLENSPFFTQKSSKPLVFGSSSFGKDAKSSPVPTIVSKSDETCSASTGITQKQPKMRKLTHFIENHPYLSISGSFAGIDSTKLLPALYMAPTKHPCNIFKNFLFKFSIFRVNIL